MSRKKEVNLRDQKAPRGQLGLEECLLSVEKEKPNQRNSLHDGAVWVKTKMPWLTYLVGEATDHVSRLQVLPIAVDRETDPRIGCGTFYLPCSTSSQRDCQ